MISEPRTIRFGDYLIVHRSDPNVPSAASKYFICTYSSCGKLECRIDQPLEPVRVLTQHLTSADLVMYAA